MNDRRPKWVHVSPKTTNPVYVSIIKKPLHLLDSVLVGIDVVTQMVDIPDLAVEYFMFLKVTDDGDTQFL